MRVASQAVSEVFVRYLSDTNLKDQGVEDIFVDWLNRKLWEQQLKQTQTVPNKKRSR